MTHSRQCRRPPRPCARARDDVAHVVDGGNVGLGLVVDENTAAVHLDPEVLEAEPLGEGPPADRHEDDVGRQLSKNPGSGVRASLQLRGAAAMRAPRATARPRWGPLTTSPSTSTVGSAGGDLPAPPRRRSCRRRRRLSLSEFYGKGNNHPKKRDKIREMSTSSMEMFDAKNPNIEHNARQTIGEIAQRMSRAAAGGPGRWGSV